MPCIEFSEVDFSYTNDREQLILDNIDLKVKKGERIGIIGENGCGKSTLIKIVLGIETPLKGTVKLKGKPANWLSSYPGIGYLGDPSHQPGSLGLPANLKVKTLLDLHKKIFAKNKVDTQDSIIEGLGLSGLMEQKVASLSTGQRKRLMICLSFRRPMDILIADEPFDGLDKGVRLFVHHLMEEKIKAGISMLYISHSIIEIDQYTDQVYELYDRKLRRLDRKMFSGYYSIGGKTERIEGKPGQLIGLVSSTFKNEIDEDFTLNVRPTHD